MATCAAIGSFGKILVKTRSTPSTPVTFDASSEIYSFLYETMSTDRNTIGTRAITGTRSIYADRQVPQAYVPRGMLGLQPGPTDLDAWLPRILGAAEVATDTFGVAEDLPVFDMLISRDNGIWRYDACRVAQARFACTSGPTEDEGEILNLGLSIVAEGETDGQSWPGTPPSTASGAGVIPYYMSQGVLTLGGTAFSFDQFELSVDNQLMVKHRNSLTPTCIVATNRVVRLEVNYPFTTSAWTQSKSLYSTGATGSIAFTSGTKSLTASFAHLRNAQKTPTIRGKGEIPLTLKMNAFRTSGSTEISFVNDIT